MIPRASVAFSDSRGLAEADEATSVSHSPQHSAQNI